MKGTFRSFGVFNYRTWALGAIVSNIGTWMQRTAQDWIVLAELTNKNATAVGVVMALQFGPQLLLMPITGYVADHYERRKILYITQATMGLLAFGLGILTITHYVKLWHVDAFAFLLGCVTAFDSPARQTFVGELVPDEDLANAVGLNSTSFNSARMIGPAVAGLLISAVGTGWVFIVNGISFVAVLISLTFLRKSELRVREKGKHGKGFKTLIDGFAYVWKKPDLRAIVIMLFLIGTFGLNFPIFISTMAVSVFHKGSSEFGLLTSTMAIGSVTGALLAASQERPRVARLMLGATMFAVGLGLAALMPSYWMFSVTLVLIGVSAQTFTTTTNTFMQLSTEPAMRGRVVAIFLAIALGTTPAGAPFIGWVADRFGPRWALGVAAAACGLAAVIGIRLSLKNRAASLASPPEPVSKGA